MDNCYVFAKMNVDHLSMPCCLSRSGVNANENRSISPKYHFEHIAPGLNLCDSPLPTGVRPSAMLECHHVFRAGLSLPSQLHLGFPHTLCSIFCVQAPDAYSRPASSSPNSVPLPVMLLQLPPCRGNNGVFSPGSLLQSSLLSH